MGQENKEIRCYDLEGNMLEDFPSLRIAAKSLKIKENMISQCVSGKSNYTGSYQFRLKKTVTPEQIGDISGLYNSGKKRVFIAKYWGGKIIAVYNAISEASEKNNIKNGLISLSIKRETLTNGFHFKEIDSI